LLNYATLLLLLYALVASQSRGATLGIGAMALFLWWQSKHKALGGVVIAVVAVGLLALAPSAYTSRMSTLSNPTDGSAQGRIDAWKAGIGMGANNPLLGVGAGSFGARWGKTAHSTYVLAFGELGLPGFICVLGIVFGNVLLTMNLRKRIRTAPPTAPPAATPPSAAPLVAAAPIKARAFAFGPRKKAAAASGDSTNQKIAEALLFSAAAMVSFGVAATFLSATYYPHLYVLTGLMVAARALASAQTGIAVSAPKARPGFPRRVV
jgi:putative inorganic carbon (hco3(-)) transporter